MTFAAVSLNSARLISPTKLVSCLPPEKGCRCIAQHDTPASFFVFHSVERRAFQVVLRFPGQHQTGILHRGVVKQPVKVCYDRLEFPTLNDPCAC